MQATQINDHDVTHAIKQVNTLPKLAASTSGKCLLVGANTTNEHTPNSDADSSNTVGSFASYRVMYAAQKLLTKHSRINRWSRIVIISSISSCLPRYGPLGKHNVIRNNTRLSKQLQRIAYQTS